MPVILRERRTYDDDWVTQLLTQRWGSTLQVTDGRVLDCLELPGLVATDTGRRVGLLTYADDGEILEIVTIDAVTPGDGIGGLLIDGIAKVAADLGARHLKVVTTNDNLDALGFYQRMGFVLVALRPEAVSVSRQFKPEIAEVAANGIPIRDEIELLLTL
ncbi:MAG TPA: GNAT family N-acetyltransferase [Mycobacteriales bacterium]|nr:GNAT family N-acetyltransferase [Mycobacteriales bacterium]